MRHKKFWFILGTTLAVMAVALVLPTRAVAASTYKVLHRFNGADGAVPGAGLIFDAAGNLYGTTAFGGNLSCNGGGGWGTVFKLAPNSDGSWTESVLHSFNNVDGYVPSGGLIFDAARSLYGTTETGGNFGVGTVFKLTHNANGTWTESVLQLHACWRRWRHSPRRTHHSFTGTDGNQPAGGGGLRRRRAISTARRSTVELTRTRAAILGAARCSSWRRTRTEAGRKARCIGRMRFCFLNLGRTVWMTKLLCP